MLKDLFNFGMKRNAKQAIGFYFFYLMMSLIIGYVASIFLLPSNFELNLEFIQGTIIIWGLGIIICSLLSILILKEKKIRNLKGYVMIALAILSSILIGNLVGIGFLAYLTTMESSADNDVQGQQQQ